MENINVLFFCIPICSNSNADLRFDFEIYLSVSKGTRPTIHSKCPEIIASIITDSWSADRTQRPTIKQMLSRLKKARAEYLQNSVQWDKLVPRRTGSISMDEIGYPFGTQDSDKNIIKGLKELDLQDVTEQVQLEDQ